MAGSFFLTIGPNNAGGPFSPRVGGVLVDTPPWLGLTWVTSGLVAPVRVELNLVHNWDYMITKEIRKCMENGN